MNPWVHLTDIKRREVLGTRVSEANPTKVDQMRPMISVISLTVTCEHSRIGNQTRIHARRG